MEFYTVSKYKRPVRLSEETRKFAYESLHDHKYGLDTVKTPAVALDDEPSIDTLNDIERYDLAIRRIAEKAPVRVCEGEKISGAATLGMAISHVIPATVGGKNIGGSVSHLTLDFESVVKRGIGALRHDAEESLRRHIDDPRAVVFLKSALSVFDSMEIWRTRYLEALSKDKRYAANLQNLTRVPFEPARNFYEAVQSIWFTFAFVRLCGNWPGIGRIDYILGDYLKNDLASGALTLDEAREILAHFFIKGCEWVRGGNCGSGDAQHYQNIVLSGIDGGGNDITNDVTYLVLDIIEELGISDFPTSIRISKNTDVKLLRRAAEVVRFGGGIIAFYGEDTVMEGMKKFGYPADEVWKFANDGCWEMQIPGETYFIYSPFDALQILQHDTFRDYAQDVSYPDFESLYHQFALDLQSAVHGITGAIHGRIADMDAPIDKMETVPQYPTTVVSVFEKGCIEKGRGYYECGPKYNVFSPHIGGFPDVVNALYAVKKVVYDEKRLTFADFMRVLQSDWEDNEALRLDILHGYAYYGNDNDECDAIAARILHDFAAFCHEGDGMTPFRHPAGVSTFGRQLEWAKNRLASPHGHKKGEVLAPNCSPTPHSDKEGATAIIKSYCKADLTEMVTGAALDIKLLPQMLEGEDGIDAFVALMRGFVMLGGCFVQPDVEDKSVLVEAQNRPEAYQTLSVRVSGWNARFVTLCKDWQDMIIDDVK